MRTFRILPARSIANNPRLLELHSPFRSVTFSGAYLPLFLLGHGLTPAQVVGLEAIFFSGFWVMWELPSGWIADKIGHARSIQLSGPFAALGFGLYGLSDQFWQFCIMELLIGIAQGLLSGSDVALLHESLSATDRADEESSWQHRIMAASKRSYMIGALGSIAIVHWFGVAATLIVDALIILIGIPILFRLTEVYSTAQRTGNFRETLRTFMGNFEVRAFMQLSIGISIITYFAVWLTAIYYQQLGITVLAVGLISFFKQFAMLRLSKWMKLRRFQYRHWWWLTGVAIAATTAFLLPMNWWFIPLLTGFDVIRTIAYPESNARMNNLIEGHYRASMHSILTMLGRGTFVILGFPIQWISTAFGIQIAMACATTIGLALAFPALVKLRRLT